MVKMDLSRGGPYILSGRSDRGQMKIANNVISSSQVISNLDPDESLKTTLLVHDGNHVPRGPFIYNLSLVVIG